MKKIIVITELGLKNIFRLPEFISLSVKTTNQALKSKGNLYTKAFGKGLFRYFTCTAWETKDDILNYRNSFSHKKAIQRVAVLASRYKTIIYEDENIPSMKETILRLKEVTYKETRKK